MRNTPSNTELEQGLQQIFPEPSAAFVNRLESQFLQQAASSVPAATRRQPVRPPRPPAFRLQRWMAAAAAVVVVIFIALAAVGPQNVVAAVQKLFGYIPNIGFIENPQQPVLVLEAPVQVKRDEVTVTVEKVLADQKSTLVRIRVDGIPQDKSLFEQGWGESSHPILQEVDPKGTAPDGKTLVANGSISGAGQFIWAEYTFPPLSAGVEQVRLLLDRLPGLEAGVAPENWVLDLPLHEVQSGDGVISTIGELSASQPVSGARLVLESTAATQDQTALKIRLSSDNPLRKADGEWWKGLVLLDDQGKPLPLTREQTLSALEDGSIVMLAPQLDPDRRYTLQLEQAGFEYRFSSSNQVPGFRLAVPGGVQVNQSWAIDETLEVEEYQLHVTQARVLAGINAGTVLRLTVEPQPGLVGIGFNCQDLQVCSSSGFDLAQPGQPLTTDVYLNQPLERSIDLKIQVMLETRRGPWEINFQPANSQ